MNIKKEKIYQRSKYKLIRNEQLKNKGHLILKQVEKTIKHILIKEKNPCIGIYWPLKGELNLKSLKDIKEFSFALPASNENGEISYHYWSKDSLGKDFLGIPAPIKEPILKPSEINLLLVPALAVDMNGYRLGYGGGYFDRLRSNTSWRSIKALVIVANSCISEKSLPRDNWDIPFDGWISENGFFEASSS